MSRNFKKWSRDFNSWSGTIFHRSGENCLVFRMTEVGRWNYSSWDLGRERIAGHTPTGNLCWRIDGKNSRMGKTNMMERTFIMIRPKVIQNHSWIFRTSITICCWVRHQFWSRFWYLILEISVDFIDFWSRLKLHLNWFYSEIYNFRS